MVNRPFPRLLTPATLELFPISSVRAVPKQGLVKSAVLPCPLATATVVVLVLYPPVANIVLEATRLNLTLMTLRAMPSPPVMRLTRLMLKLMTPLDVLPNRNGPQVRRA